jgi:hypothetical protein
MYFGSVLSKAQAVLCLSRAHTSALHQTLYTKRIKVAQIVGLRGEVLVVVSHKQSCNDLAAVLHACETSGRKSVLYQLHAQFCVQILCSVLIAWLSFFLHKVVDLFTSFPVCVLVLCLPSNEIYCRWQVVLNSLLLQSIPICQCQFYESHLCLHVFPS